MGTKTTRSVEAPTIDVPSTPRIVDQIAQHLTDDEWQFRVDGTDINLVTHGDSGLLEVLVSCEEEAERYFVYAYCPVNVPATHQGEVATYLVGANLPLACAKLMMAPNGRVYTEAGIPLGTDGIVDAKVFRILLRLTLSVIDDRVPDILNLVYSGLSASDVLARREQGNAPKG